MRYIFCQRNGINVAGEYYAGIEPAIRPGAHGIAVAGNLDVQTAQRFFDGVCDGLLMVGGARNINERLG